MLKIYSDAAVSQKHKCTGAGIVVAGGDIHEQITLPLPEILDNHLAELHAFYLAVKWAIDQEQTAQWITFYTDSQLVAQAINKQYIKKNEYIALYKEIILLLDQFEYYEVKWIPEKSNKGADNLAKQAIAKQLKKKR